MGKPRNQRLKKKHTQRPMKLKTQHPNLWDAARIVPRGKIIAT